MTERQQVETTDTGLEIHLAQAQAVLAAQPFSVHLGARLVAFSRDGAVLHLPVRAELHQQHGFVHGGVLSYLVDNAITFAAGAVLGPDVVTGGFSIDYLRPATGSLLTAEARTVRAGAQQAVVRCEVMDHQDDESRLCAIGQGRVLRRATEG